MAKKKHFAGKKTKLAKLPLTQVLASQVESGALFPASPPASLAEFRQHSLRWDEVSAGGEDPLSAFLYVVRELADLKSQLHCSLGSTVVHYRLFLPDRIPPRARLLHALRQARQSLRELQSLLNHP